MKMLNKLRGIAATIVMSVALCATASATDVLNVNSQVLTTDPTQQGRLSRNGIPQDWSGTETFPGIINTGVTYHYTTFTIAANVVAAGPFMQISLLDLGPVSSQGNIFVSAFSNTYLPPPGATGSTWLGDAGFSGNNFGNAVFFQVLVPAGASLVIVVTNTAGGNVGTNEPFNLLVESFSDNQFSPARPIPEGGATVLLLSMGVAGLFLLRRHVRLGA